jgi:3-phenylpropionate/cinnamic acid dioxygenase small subunit
VTGAAPTYAEAVEAVRAAIATYTHALDDGRTDDVVAMFCPDGSFEFPSTGRVEGHEALRQTYAGWVPRRPQRHLVTNTLVTAWDAEQVTAVSDVVLLVQVDTAWTTQFVARYHDVLHAGPEGWRFHSRTVVP